MRLYARWHHVGDTYGVYVGHVRKACELLSMDASCFGEIRIANAKRGLVQQNQVFRPPKEALRGSLLARVIRAEVANTQAKLFVLVSWVFLLRASNEATGLVRVADDSPALDPYVPPCRDASIGRWGVEVVVRLRRRKNRPAGDVIRRACSCGGARSSFQALRGAFLPDLFSLASHPAQGCRGRPALWSGRGWGRRVVATSGA